VGGLTLRLHGHTFVRHTVQGTIHVTVSLCVYGGATCRGSSVVGLIQRFMARSMRLSFQLVGHIGYSVPGYHCVTVCTLVSLYCTVCHCVTAGGRVWWVLYSASWPAPCGSPFQLDHTRLPVAQLPQR